MKKEELYSYKPWLILSVFVLSMVLVTFSSVNAADPDLAGNAFDSWSTGGYRTVTVELPSEVKIPAAAPQDECVLDTNGLVSHWPLDETAGATTFVDVAGSINGTCDNGAGTCPTRSFGKVGGAYTFTASEQDIITVPADVPPGLGTYNTMANGDFSAGVWVKTTQACKTNELNNKVFFGRYRDAMANGTWWLGCTIPDGEVDSVAVFRLRDSSNNARQIDGTSKINDGMWHYIVGVRDAGSDVNYLYVDGELEGTLNAPAYIADADKFSSDDPITMGAYDIPTPYYLDGTLDEVVLYDRVMPENEISTYYDACEAASAVNYIPIVYADR
jgi:hypothetical protein